MALVEIELVGKDTEPLVTARPFPAVIFLATYIFPPMEASLDKNKRLFNEASPETTMPEVAFKFPIVKLPLLMV